MVKRVNVITYIWPEFDPRFQSWKLLLYPYRGCNVFTYNFKNRILEFHISTQSFLSSVSVFDHKERNIRRAIQVCMALPSLFAVPFYRNVSHAEINWFVRSLVGVIYTRSWLESESKLESDSILSTWKCLRNKQSLSIGTASRE